MILRGVIKRKRERESEREGERNEGEKARM